MSVYFVQCGQGGPIKIGISETVWLRLVKMQSDSPYPMSLLAEIDGGIEEERRLHAHFAAARIRGEWFWPVQSLLDFIEENKPRPREVEASPAEVPVTPDELNPLRPLRESLGFSQRQMAERLGVTQPTICRMERDETLTARTRLALVGLVEQMRAKNAPDINQTG